MLDFDYCGRRARDERAIALASPCAKARAIHFELATLYDRRAQQPLVSVRASPSGMRVYGATITISGARQLG